MKPHEFFNIVSLINEIKAHKLGIKNNPEQYTLETKLSNIFDINEQEVFILSLEKMYGTKFNSSIITFQDIFDIIDAKPLVFKTDAEEMYYNDFKFLTINNK